MGLPSKLKNLNAYIDGEGYIGRIAEFEVPKLAIATEDWRGGGMLGPVKIDMGLEAMETSITMGGHEAQLIRKFGTTRIDGVRVRLIEAFQADNGSSPDAVEHYIGGRFAEIDLGKSKAGDNTEHKFKVPLSYYRRVVNGRTDIEIDLMRGIFIVDGFDRYAEIMSIISS